MTESASPSPAQAEPVKAPSAEAIIAFWQEAGPAKWFAHDEEFDAAIRARFEGLHHAAARGELAQWTADWQGTLALLLLLDQFPRNLYRGSAHSYAADPLARAVANAALKARQDRAAPEALRVFYYLPFEHSEDLADQDRCLALCQALDAETGSTFTQWAQLHRDIVARFGRFPHRNAALGRISSAEELQFLAEGGFAG